MPNGWKLGSVYSDGVTWLLGSNNVNITSDVGTGDNSFIKIRANNSACAPNLLPGYEKYLPIIRPEPNILIAASNNYICTVGGTTTLSLNNIPIGASINWEIVYPPNEAELVGCTTCSSATLKKTGSGNVIVTAKATVTHCTYSYQKTINITLGTPPFGIITPYLNYCLGGSDWELGLEASSIDPTVTQYLWTRDGYPAGSSQSWYTYEFPPECMTIGLKVGNACGFSPEGTQVFCPPCSFKMLVSPNPSKDKINVKFENLSPSKDFNKNSKIKFRLIKTNTSQVMREWEFLGFQETYSINLLGIKKGIYILEFNNGKEKTTKQIIIE